VVKVQRAEGRAVVDVEFTRQAAGQKGLAQGIEVSIKVLAQGELGMADESAHVIDKGDKIGLSVFPFDTDRWSVHEVGLPDVVGEFCLVAPAVYGSLLSLHEPLPLEQSPDRALGQVLLGIHQAALLRHADQAAYGALGHFPA
jgi:hypothetical protein